MSKIDDAWEIIRRMMAEPVGKEGGDFKTEDEKWDWIAKRYKEFQEAQEKK